MARFQSLGQEDPLEEEIPTTPVFLPGKSQGQRSLASDGPWSLKESDTTEATSHSMAHGADAESNCWAWRRRPQTEKKSNQTKQNKTEPKSDHHYYLQYSIQYLNFSKSLEVGEGNIL